MYLTAQELAKIAAFKRDNIAEDDRNHFGIGPSHRRSKTYDVDQRVSEAIIIAGEMHKNGLPDADKILKLQNLPTPEHEGGKFNLRTRTQLSEFLLGIVKRMQQEQICT